ncbi:hypothetical protein V5O48_015107 [Marasmius crinis-equi]|uniref:Uncharacterized protein n=1 Tax=Marasmius crinis-equi TaxID=585013 RepID=A0ABR3EVI0_9AGAR
MGFFFHNPPVKRAPALVAPFLSTATTKSSECAKMSLRCEESEYSDGDFSNPEFVSALVNSIPALADTDASPVPQNAPQNAPSLPPNTSVIAPAMQSASSVAPAMDIDTLSSPLSSPSKRRLKLAANAPRFLHNLASERNLYPVGPPNPPGGFYVSQNTSTASADTRHLSPHPARSPIPQNYPSTPVDTRFLSPNLNYPSTSARLPTPQGAPPQGTSAAAEALSKLVADPSLAMMLGVTPDAILDAITSLSNHNASADVQVDVGDSNADETNLSVPPIQALNGNAADRPEFCE